MILKRAGSDLFVITQPDHAALSAHLIERFALPELVTRPTRDAVLTATQHHDIGWMEEDVAPSIDPATGFPYEFTTLPADARQRIWPRAVARLRPRSTYVAALVAQHAITVYGRYQEDETWRLFFDTMTTLRDDAFEASERPGFSASSLDPGPPARQLFLQDYGFVAVGDLMSLAFCAGWAETYDADRFRIVCDGSMLSVSPDPFDGARVPFRVRARRLPLQPFASSEDLRDALASAPEEWLEGTASG